MNKVNLAKICPESIKLGAKTMQCGDRSHLAITHSRTFKYNNNNNNNDLLYTYRDLRAVNG